MKNRLLCLCLLMISINGFSQDLASTKNYNFAELFAEIQNEMPVFIATLSEIDKGLHFLPDNFLIIFPLIEEKETMDFSKGTRQKKFTPVISFRNFYEKKPSFTIHSSYGQYEQGEHKILKGYDYCLRPIY